MVLRLLNIVQRDPSKAKGIFQTAAHYTRELRELKITTTATATATSLNKRFNEENNGFARAL